MSRAVRLLDATAFGLGGLTVAILATGGWTVGGWPLTRAEDAVVVLAVVVGLRALVRPIEVPPVRPDHAVAVGVGLHAAVMSFIVLTRHQALRTHALDLGYYVQVVWSLAAGHGAWVTLPPMHPWGDHLSPVLYAFVPFAWLWPGAGPLLVGQTLILAAGGWAVFQLAWLRLRDWRVAAGLGLLYLVNPSLHGINLRDLHPQAFAIPLLIAAALAFDGGRYGWCALALGLTLACREDAAVAVVGFAVWLALARRRWALGAVVAVASVALLALDLAVIMPHFRGTAYPHLGRYAHLGTSLGEILVSFVARPWRWLAVLADARKLGYLLAMLAPLGFLPLLAPRTLAAALPGLAMNLLALDPVLFHHRTQYQAFVLPFLVLAAIDGSRRLRAWVGRGRIGSALSPAAALALGFVVSAALTARTVNDLAVTRWLLGPEAQAAHRLMAQVPGEVPISANERLVPHLATRRQVFIFPTGLPASEYVLDLASARVPARYVMVVRDGPWVLWRRRGD